MFVRFFYTSTVLDQFQSLITFIVEDYAYQSPQDEKNLTSSFGDDDEMMRKEGNFDEISGFPPDSFQRNFLSFTTNEEESCKKEKKHVVRIQSFAHKNKEKMKWN
jgi:hypothetical protein